MASIVRTIASPLNELGAPIYYLCRDKGSRKANIERLTLAALRTATAAAFFFTVIPFNEIFGHKDNFSCSLAFASQFIVHPYAASLFNAFINGGFLLILKSIDLVFKRQLILTRNDVGSFARAIGFLYAAYFLKEGLSSNPLDLTYRQWARKLAAQLAN